jgi:hypothetical protein
MKQLSLNLRPSRKSAFLAHAELATADMHVALHPNDTKLTAPSDGLFHFTGHIKRETRPGRFQYRFGRKVLPHDVIITLPAGLINPPYPKKRVVSLLQPAFDF